MIFLKFSHYSIDVLNMEVKIEDKYYFNNETSTIIINITYIL